LTKQQIISARIFIGYGCLDAVDQDTSSKQEVAIVLIYSCQYIFTPLQNFNTQPPEGGWDTQQTSLPAKAGFQHTAA